MKIKLDKPFTPSKTICSDCGQIADKVKEEDKDNPNVYRCKCGEFQDMTNYEWFIKVNGFKYKDGEAASVGGKKNLFVTKINDKYFLETR